MITTAIECIKAAQSEKIVDEDGETVTIKLSRPLSPAEIDSLEKRTGQPLPDELRTLLAFCSGLEGCLETIDFTASGLSFEQKEVFANGLSIAHDGFGNFWIVDITPQTRLVAPVYFACHDAPVILYQSQDIASFLEEVFRMHRPPHKSLIDDVHEDRLFEVWRRNPGVLDYQTAVNSPDPAVSSFAKQLSDNFQIIDLRLARPGMGFSWGRYGPKTEVRRFGYERIFAYAKPRTRSLFAKIFGK